MRSVQADTPAEQTPTTWVCDELPLSHRVVVRRAGRKHPGDPVIVLHDAGAESVDAEAWARLAQARGDEFDEVAVHVVAVHAVVLAVADD